VPIVCLNVPLAQSWQSPLEPCFPTPHVATHGRPVSGPAARPRLVVCDALALRDAGGRGRRRRMQRTRLARPRPVRGRVRARGARPTVGELLRHGAVEVARVALALLAQVPCSDAEGRLRRTLHARVRVAQRQLRLAGRTRPALFIIISAQPLVPGVAQARQRERPRRRQRVRVLGALRARPVAAAGLEAQGVAGSADARKALSYFPPIIGNLNIATISHLASP
jgi:hypothetical protein